MLGSPIPLVTSPRTPTDEYESKLCEMSIILSPSSTQLLNSLLNELHIKFEDVDLNCDEYVTYDELLDVLGEFGATLPLKCRSDDVDTDGGYAMIWNKLLMEQNEDMMMDHDLLSIPFLVSYMKPFIITSIQQTTNGTIHNNYDEILSLTLKLILNSDSLSEIGSPTVACSTFQSESYLTVNALNRKHRMIQGAIKELLQLSVSFPTITKRKQKRYEALKYADNMDDIDIAMDEKNDYLDLIGNFMSISSYNSYHHKSPPKFKMRIRRRKRRKYNLVSEEDDDDDDAHSDEYEEIDIDEERVSELYNQRKNKIFDKYIEKEVTMAELMDAYRVAITSVDNNCILRAIGVFDAATNQHAPIFMKFDQIKLYLAQRGLAPNEIDLAFKCSAAAFHQCSALQLANTQSNEASISRSHTHHNHHNYTTNNIVIPSPHSSHLVTSPFMARKNSNFVANEVFYPTQHRENKKTLHKAKKTAAAATDNYRAKICYSKTILIAIAFVLLCIFSPFVVCQLLHSQLYVAPCNESDAPHDIACRQKSSVLVDSVNWNYWFKYDEHMEYDICIDSLHLALFACFAAICLFVIYFMVNVAIGGKNWCSKNVYFGSTHWFVMMMLCQVIMISVQSIRLLHLSLSKRAFFVLIFSVFVGCVCIINGSLYLLVLFHYIENNINDKDSIIWRERGFVCILIFDMISELMFLVLPYLLNVTLISSSSSSSYKQHLGVFLHCDGVIEWISNLIAMVVLSWHMFDMIALLEQQCALHIFGINYDEMEHAEYLQSATQPTNVVITRRRPHSITATATATSTRHTSLSRRSTRRSTLSKLSERESIINETREVEFGAYHEPSIHDDIVLPDYMPRGGGDAGGGTSDNDLIIKTAAAAAVPSAKMIRNKHATTKRMFTCARIVAILLIAYGMVVMTGIVYRVSHSQHTCLHPNTQQIRAQPSLMVWKQCEFKLHPLINNNNCECLKFKWRISSHIEYMELHGETQALNMTPQHVLQSVLNDFKLVEIVYIEWYFLAQQNVSSSSCTIESDSMRALYLLNVAMGRDTLLRVPQLEVLNIKYSKWSFDSANASLVSSPYLRMLALQNMNLYRIPPSICSLSHLQALDLSATFIEHIPSCLLSLNLLSFNLLFNALSGRSIHEDLLLNRELLIIAPAQMIQNVAAAAQNNTQLYLQYNPICADDDDSFCDDSLMCDVHCISDIMRGDGVCDPFCDVEQCDYDGGDCEEEELECRSAIAWFQTIDADSNGHIQQNEMNQNAVQLILNNYYENNVSSNNFVYPMNFNQFVNHVWIKQINCSLY